MKHIHKLIALSGTYGQSSRVALRPRRDPRNLYFSRGPRLRMSAEMIRDNALLVSGLLSEKWAAPRLSAAARRALASNRTQRTEVCCCQKRGSFPSRGLRDLRRAAPYASFVNFDGPDRSSCFPKRSRTNTPLQALTLLNDQAYVRWLLVSPPPSFGRKACLRIEI